MADGMFGSKMSSPFSPSGGFAKRRGDQFRNQFGGGRFGAPGGFGGPKGPPPPGGGQFGRPQFGGPKGPPPRPGGMAGAFGGPQFGRPGGPQFGRPPVDYGFGRPGIQGPMGGPRPPMMSSAAANLPPKRPPIGYPETPRIPPDMGSLREPTRPEMLGRMQARMDMANAMRNRLAGRAGLAGLAGQAGMAERPDYSAGTPYRIPQFMPIR